MIGFLLAATLAASQSPDRTYEGDWYIADSTDNNTGRREVYAFQTFIKGKDYVSLRMVCADGTPAFVVEWEDIVFPDHTVLTLGPVFGPDAEPQESAYVFRQSITDGVIDRGLIAAPEVSKTIISAIGDAKYVTVKAHLPSGSRTVGIEVDGTASAWKRVSRHCPVAILPLPPI
jgi:hypothetical protein